MKAVNLTIDEELWKAARAEAGRRDMSVSALMRSALKEHLHSGQSGETEEVRRHRMVDLLEACQIDLTEQPARPATYASSRFH